MQRNSLLIFLVMLITIGFYFLGKKNGASDTKISMVENVEMIKQIAELAALDVTGNVKLKISNTGDENGAWSKFKNYFSENTLLVTLPYEAKFGVDMSNQKMKIDTKANTIIIYLPHCKLLSMQLKMDKMETMAQTGIFASASMDDLVKAQKQLYLQALQNMEKDPAYISLAEKHIEEILNNYYKPLGYKVTCKFSENKAAPAFN
jgi:hypothetical protein